MERDGIAKHESSDSSTNYRYWVRESGEGAAPPPVPKKLSADDVSKQQASQTNPSLGSVWNKAGTWEEKNLNAWASSRIKELLTSLGRIEFSNGKADIYEVSRCTGDAFLVTVRNKKRFSYTYELTIRFKGEWMVQEEMKNIKGHICVHEFMFGELDELQMDVNLSEAKDLPGNVKSGIIKDMKSILPAICDKLLRFEDELKNM
ncbi:hypothetical protein ZOSMA_50G00280 [Zostera marina]|uniref:Activator of Hsp90 ATPase AHSA1-like N-terminal domain-containing protein n=1 Tax=Zostera marina TaxID=29655 RepID=A0A0K9NY08_ZOSMR|nr:hypothetical protein ZOSMA_50G00280 [Zostera marina]